jgi:zinc protease
MNRNTAPELQLIDRLDIKNYKQTSLTNGVEVYYVNSAEEQLVRIELRFRAGRWYEPQPAISRAVCNIMRKGTSTKTAKQIADIVEFYGAQMDVQSGQDYTSFVIFCLSKHLDKLMPVAEEILLEANYPQDELDLFIQKQKQKLRINAQNTDFHANRKFNNVLFGEQHPYGYSVNESTFDNIQSGELIQFQRKHYSPGDATIFVAGAVTENTLSLLEKHFGKYQPNGKIISATDKSIHTNPQHKHYIDKDDSVQSSVRIGTLSISKTHPDFAELNVLNTAFGGYFGSRLMTNIREDKGYTYGIYSTIVHYVHSSYFSIETEVGNEVCAAAIAEVYKEMDALKTTAIDDEELTIIKNYMMGGLLRATDGPFNRINVVKNMVMSGLTTAYFDGLANAIKTVTAERLMELANQYFDYETMKEVVCGKKV